MNRNDVAKARTDELTAWLPQLFASIGTDLANWHNEWPEVTDPADRLALVSTLQTLVTRQLAAEETRRSLLEYAQLILAELRRRLTPRES